MADVQKLISTKEVINFWPLIIAVAATVVFGLYTWHLAWQVTRQDGVVATRYVHFLSGRPNELGDTLAGFVGSLTLIWVIASVIQQSMELRAQRKEFSEMVSAQSAQVKALEAQSQIFQSEKIARDEEAQRKILVERLITLRRYFKSIGAMSISWTFDSADRILPDDLNMSQILGVYSPFSGFGHNEEDIEEYLRLSAESLQDGVSKIVSEHPLNKPNRTYQLPILIKKSRGVIELIIFQRSSLSESERIRLDRMDLESILANLRIIAKLEKLWERQTP